MPARSDDLRLAGPRFLADALVFFSILLAMHYSRFSGKEAECRVRRDDIRGLFTMHSHDQSK